MGHRASSVWVGLVLAVAGCDDNDDGASTPDRPEDTATFARWPSAVLPWKARATQNTLVGDGVEVLLPLVYRPAWNSTENGGQLETPITGALVATVALRDHIVVVFPPADRDGFDLAWAGVDSPWQRVPLVDLMPRDVGTLDAAAGPDGTVYVVLRERATMALRLVTWRPGEAPVDELIARSGSAQPSWWSVARCPDVAVGVDARGGLDVVFKQDFGIVQRAHRAPGAATFTFDTIVDTTGEPWTSLDIRDWGCRSRLEYDESGRPVVALLLRQIPQQYVDAVPGVPLQRTARLFVLGGDGRWRPGFELFVPDWSWWRGQFELGRHPLGYLLFGMTQGSGLGAVAMLSWSLVFDLTPRESRPDSNEEQRRVDKSIRQGDGWTGIQGGVMRVNACGMSAVFTSEVDVMRGAHNVLGPGMAIGSFSGLNCVFDRYAPVRDDASTASDGPRRHPAPAHGLRSYDAATCLAPDGTLAVCMGAQPARDVLRDDELVRIAASSLAQGRDDLPTTPAPVTLTLAAPVPADRELFARLMDLADARSAFLPVELDAERTTATVRMELLEPWLAGESRTLGFPLAPGHRFRLVITAGPSSPGQANQANVSGAEWMWARADIPVIDFATAGARFDHPDPRDEPPLIPCDREDYAGYFRNAEDACELAEPIGAAVGVVSLLLAYDEPLALEPPRLLDAAGQVVPGTTYVSGDPSRAPELHWSGTLAPGARYHVEYPAGIVNVWGGLVPEADRHFYFRTAAE